MFEGLAGFGNEPRILHRDDRLPGEILNKRDLFFRKRTDFLAIDNESSEKRIVLAQRHAQYGPSAA